MSVAVPLELRTERLILRPFSADDAPALQPLLAANVDHLSPWIPEHVWRPLPLAPLAQRLRGFAEAFADNRQWRYAVCLADDGTLVGEVDLFPRNESGRVAFPEADRAEIGYWLRADWTGRGLATEAAAAMLTLARSLPRFTHVIIRCDSRNAPSAAVPRRLGFTLTETEHDDGAVLHVWTLPLRATPQHPNRSTP